MAVACGPPGPHPAALKPLKGGCDDAPVAADVRFSVLVLAVWGSLTAKDFSRLGVQHNMQALSGGLLMAVLSAAWPLLHAPSFRRWRPLSVSALRLALFAMPFPCSQHAFDEAYPARAHPVTSLLSVFVGTRMALLLNCGLCWEAPLAWHLPVQAACVALVACYGTTAFCGSQLLSSPQVDAAVDALHRLMAAAASPMAPAAAALVPTTAFARRAAALLFCYVIEGWLAPTLLQMHFARAGCDGDGAQQVQPGSGGVLASAAAAYRRLVAAVEAQLQPMLPAPQRAKRHEDSTGELDDGDDELLPGAMRALRWWLALVATWAVCCTLAPVFEPQRP